jgi:hypothetical protein
MSQDSYISQVTSTSGEKKVESKHNLKISLNQKNNNSIIFEGDNFKTNVCISNSNPCSRL